MTLITTTFIAGGIGFFTSLLVGLDPMYAAFIGIAPVALFFISCVAIGVVKEIIKQVRELIELKTSH